jgi:hypothetical protein
MTKVSNASILFDLEYRGINDFLSEIACGVRVPTCFVARIAKIIDKAYGTKMVAESATTATTSGSYCLMTYTDQTYTTLVNVGE